MTFLVTARGDGHDAVVDDVAVDAHLAVLAGCWTEAAFRSRPNSSPELLDHQHRSLAGSVAWLRERWAARWGDR